MGEESCLGLTRVCVGGTLVRPGNSKISLLILSRLRVSDCLKREAFWTQTLEQDYGQRQPTEEETRPRNLYILLGFAREEGKCSGLHPPSFQPPSPASILRGLSPSCQIWERDPTVSPSDPALQVDLQRGAT